MSLSDLNPNSPETKVPALPAPQSAQQLLQALKELIEVREGIRGNPLDQSVTWRELVKSGLAEISINGQSLGGGDPTFPLQPSGGTEDLSPPPQPTGLTASGAIQNVILGWSDPGNPNIALTEVWRSATNVAPDTAGTTAVLIGTTESYLYADMVGQSAVTRYYWVRFRSKYDVEGPFSAVVSGSTGQVGGVDLSDLVVTAAKLATDAVESGKIKDAAVTTTKIANLAVGNAAIANGAITNAKIGDLAVDSAKIADAAIVEAKIADASVTNAKIGTAAITDAKIASATITTASIANAAITGAKIANATITAANITDATITAAKIADATITTAKIADAQISGAKIGSATITGANIATGTIGAANITDATITGAKIASATITNANINDLNAAKINAGTLAAARIAAGTITGTMIAGDTIVAGNIASGAITTDELSAEAVTAAKIKAGTITANEIAANTITAGKIAAGTITATEIATDTITAAKMKTGTITAASGILADAVITSAKIADSIQSSNYSSTTGWKIDRAGTATFYNATIRGSLNADDITAGSLAAARIDSRGLTIKDAAGNLLFGSGDSVAGIKNLVGNSSFKLGAALGGGASSGTVPYGWTTYNNGGLSMVHEVQAGGPFGAYFARVIATQTNANTLGICVTGTEARVKYWIGGTGFYVSFYARGGNDPSRGGGTGVGLKMTATYSNSLYSSATNTNQPTLTGEWQRYVFYVVVSSTATDAINAGELFISKLTSDTIYPGGYVDIACPQVEVGIYGGATSWGLSAFDSIGLTNPINSGNISTYIAGAAIGTAFIGDAAITSAKIGDAEVGTLKIAGNAVTVPVSVNTVANVWSNIGNDTPVISVPVTTNVGTYAIAMLSCADTEAFRSEAYNGGLGGYVAFNLQVNGASQFFLGQQYNAVPGSYYIETRVPPCTRRIYIPAGTNNTVSIVAYFLGNTSSMSSTVYRAAETSLVILGCQR